MPRGRPKKYTVTDVQRKIDDYFARCFEERVIDGSVVKVQIRPFTITGLAVALDMTRQMLLEYQGDEKYGDTIKRAKAKCEQFAEEQLFVGKNAAGVIFNLKNNYANWRDRTEQEVTGANGGPLEMNVNTADPIAIEARINELIAKRGN